MAPRSNLLSDPTDPETPTAVHINLAHILPSHVDTLLFELLKLGQFGTWSVVHGARG